MAKITHLVTFDLSFEQVVNVVSALYNEARRMEDNADTFEKAHVRTPREGFRDTAKELRADATVNRELANEMKFRAYRAGDNRYKNFVEKVDHEPMALKAECHRLALTAIEHYGLHVIRDGDKYAVSIDGCGDDDVSDEQRRVCWWYLDPGEAAYAYCRRNDIPLRD